MSRALFERLDGRGRIFLVVLALLCLAIAVGNLAFEPDSAFYVPTYIVSLLGKYLTYALLALSVDLVWGYCGVLSLGHGAFFALGGYAMGMYLMRQIGSRGVYGHPELPDFMVFLNWQELPWFWYGFDMFWFACLMVVVAPVDGARCEPQALFEFLVPRMAHFMLPRYIRVVDELPKTPTAKVRKHVLREQGVTEATWDREDAGIRVTRDGVSR